jgi:hypothetical protein
VWWDVRTKTATCGTCLDLAANGEAKPTEYHPPQPQLTSCAGASAQLKFEWLAAQDSGAAPGEASAYARQWEAGADGERRVGAVLDSIARPDLKVIHDVRLPGSFANIDHIAVAPSGVLVIDSKNWNGKVKLIDKGLDGEPNLRLVVAGRDRTKKADSVRHQALCVQMVLEDFAPLEQTLVKPVLCLVSSDWREFNAKPDLNGIALTWLETLADYVDRPGPLDAGHVDMVWMALALRFKPAV